MMIAERVDGEHDWRGGLEAGPEYTPAGVPVAGEILSVIVAILVQVLLAVCLTRVWATFSSWRRTPIALWLLLAIYVDSFLFAFASSVLRFGIGVNDSLGTCKGAILICIIFYLSTKVLIYYYFVEKCYLVRGCLKPRHKTKLYLFNVFCALGPYVILCWLNVAWRIHYIDENGSCIIGMERQVLWPLVAFEVFVNVWLTALFLGPLCELYSFKNKAQSKMRKVAMRTFVGVCVTLTTSVANLSVLTTLNGEQGWVCLLICTSDVFISVMVLHWVAMSDESRADDSTPLKIRITRAMTPARRPTPLPSFQPSSLASPGIAVKNERLNPLNEFPWVVASPVETTISSGHTGLSTSEDGDIFPLDASKIHVKVKHEMSESSLQKVRKAGDV